MNLREITIPDNITNIGMYAFGYCTNLKVTLSARTPPNLGEFAFSHASTLAIYVPCGTIDIYKKTTTWKTHSEYIKYAPSPYKITLNVNNIKYGSISLSETGRNKCNDRASITAEPKEGCYFLQWSDGYKYKTRGINITCDTTFIAEFDINKYNVDFVDWNDSLLLTQQVNYGNTAIPPQDPVREGYVFTGWDKDFSSVKEDMTITATYKVLDALNNLLFKQNLEEILANSETRIYTLQGIEVTNMRERLPQGTYIFRLGDKVGKAVIR